MEAEFHSISSLFLQLGLNDSREAIDAFISTHRPLPADIALDKADFWSTSQSSFLKQVKEEDADWVGIVDQLDVMLR
ncbi:MAG: DUF2789 domain-containing protein [Pseudomonadales bacterium]|jgi:hypothetical protein